jgi:heat-inducible transcriptional repressor
LKSPSVLKPPKGEREKQVLLGLVDLYLKTGKPIGSNTLKDNGFSALSAATIRNYYVKLENQGYLHQQHTSGGRVPTNKAFRYYAKIYLNQGTVEDTHEIILKTKLKKDTKQIHKYLQEAAEELSSLTQLAVFMSSPRFDQDLIEDIKVIQIDDNRLLCVLITSFGIVKTEVLYISDKIEEIDALRSYFLWRMSKTTTKPHFNYESDAKWAQRLYNEVVVRHIAGYAHFFKEDTLQTGLSRLLNFPEFADATSLYNGLAILEDEFLKQKFLKDSVKENKLKFWIGDDLNLKTAIENTKCALVSIPYYINNIPVGAVAILGPTRINYRNIFGILRLFSHYLSDNLTQSIYKYKIQYRQPSESMSYDEIKKDPSILLEDQSK